MSPSLHSIPQPVRYRLALLALLGLSGCTFARQVPDMEFRYANESPRYEQGAGPRIAIDAGHENFHTVDGRFGPFAQLLRDDGYIVESFDHALSVETLATVDVLVIANSLSRENRVRWKLPTAAAFSAAEITTLRTWIEGGGALMLIADHMPFPGAAEGLAADLGIFFTNGYARDGDDNGHIIFSRDAGTLHAHPITEASDLSERIDSVKVFTGQAFRVAADADFEPLMVLPEGSRVLLPTKPRKFDERTPYVLAEGLLQGATLRIGNGRVAVFGEAAMFTAQAAVTRTSRTSFGMSGDDAQQNPRFALNIVHWLSSTGPQSHD